MKKIMTKLKKYKFTKGNFVDYIGENKKGEFIVVAFHKEGVLVYDNGKTDVYEATDKEKKELLELLNK